MRRLLARARSLWNTLAHKDRLDRDLDEELEGAVETLARRHVADGMDPAAARRAAMRALGGPGGIGSVRAAVRDHRVGAATDTLLLDARDAWRGLRGAPGLAAVVVLTLALGIGATTAIFSVVHAMLLEPLPYRNADRLTFIWLDRTSTAATVTGLGYPRGPMSGPDLRNLREDTRTFEAFGGIWATGSVVLAGDNGPEQLRSAQVTTNFFDVLGVQPAYGRTFRPEDATGQPPLTVMLGWDLFQRRFGGDPSLVGRQIRSADGTAATVIGILPKDFRLLLPPDAAIPDRLQAFVPFWPDLESGPRRNLFLRVIGRMRPGVTIEQAREDVAALSRHLTTELGSQRAFTVVRLHDDDVREIRGPLLALFGGVVILLTIACVNVASLLIARAATRVKERSLRLALGASRARLVRQALVEGSLLTIAGGAAGVFVGYLGLRVLLTLLPESLSRLEASRIDLAVLAFALGISVVWGLLVSLAPCVELFKADAARSLGVSRASGAPVRYRARATLVIAQIALSLVLLSGAGLLVRAFARVVAVDPGFRADRQLTFRTLVPGETFVRDLLEQLRSLPGVTGAGAFSHLPYDDLPNWGLPYSLTSPIPQDAPTADARSISPGLMEALGIELIEGRFFTEHDRDASHPVVIVDDRLAGLFWPGRSALEQTFFANVGESRHPTVIGVVRHVRLRSLVQDLLPQIYVPWPMAQRNPMAFVVSTSGDPMSVAAEVRAAVSAVDPRLVPHDLRPMADYVEGARATRGFTVILASAFAVVAVVLSCIGIYGVLAYAVAGRRHEFGVRRALGADTGRILRDVLREGFGFASAGCAAGLAGAFVAGRLLQSQLYEVHPHDPITVGTALGVILAGALAACAVPAYRATTVSPMDALRSE